MESLKGQLLIAVPSLADANFFRTVVLMFQHDDQGGMGLVLNRPLDITVGEVWSEAFEVELNQPNRLHYGGPVEGPLILLSSCREYSEAEILPKVYLTMETDPLQAIVQQDLSPWRLFSGYSGWGPGQLESELEMGGWLILSTDSETVFSDTEQLWKKVCNRFGAEILHDQWTGSLPSDPRLN